MMMIHKIEKNYLNNTLKNLDTDNNQIIDLDEWFGFFQNNSDNLWLTAKNLVSEILGDIFPNENSERLPILAESILINHSEETTEIFAEKKINFMQLYNYIVRFIAPQKYHAYQQSLTDKTDFFLYDGMITRHKLDIFTNDDNRLLCADIYYLIVSYHIEPNVALEIIEHLINNPAIAYNPNDFTIDADGLFYTLAIQKSDNSDAIVIDADAILHYGNTHNMSGLSINVPHLFAVHNDLVQKIVQTGQVNYETAYNFLNFYNKNYLELGIKSLCDALFIALDNELEMLNLIDFLGYTGKPDKIFREIAGNNSEFSATEFKEFLKDNSVKFIEMFA
jgi:hypothetical protein